MNKLWTWTGSLFAGKSFWYSDELFSCIAFYERLLYCSLVFLLFRLFKCRSYIVRVSAKWFESPFIVGFQIYPLKEDKFEFWMFFCSCHTCSCLVVVVECFLQPQSQIFRDFLNFMHLTSDWTKSNGTQFETEIPCTNLGIYVLVSSESLFEVLKLMSFSFA